MNDSQRLHAFTSVYDQLDREADHDALLASLYHPKAVFQDPFHRLEGLTAIQSYFSGMYQSVDQITFHYGQYWPSSEADFLRWSMVFCHPAIAAGKAIHVEGGTEFRWQDDWVIYHQDLFDGATMLYNHLPVLGWVLGKIRERMA